MSPQLAAVLVTDMVGSTELRVRLGEDGAEELRRAHDRMVGDTIRGHEGRVVKSLGDGILGCFPSAAEAAAAAVAIQRGVGRLDPRASETTLQLRIGLAAGDVTEEDGDIFGTPVVEASRLCAAAAGGQILAADMVRVLSHGRGGQDFLSLGPLELKGLPEPIEACEVAWQPEAVEPAPASVPFPLALSDTSAMPFVGRGVERETLANRWKHACVEGRQVVLLAGEPGIGKTRLVSELARDAYADGATVVVGRCFEDRGVAFAPFSEALRDLVENCPIEILVAHVDAMGSDIVRIVPELGRRLERLAQPPEADVELQRARLYDAVVDLLSRAAVISPVMLVLDDLHWADASSVELLLWLARATTPMRVAIVGTYRDTDVSRSHPFGSALADLRRIRDVERVAVGGLDDEEVATLIEALAGYDLDDDGRQLAHILYGETEGNPFFLGEVLIHLAESGAIRRDGDRWVATRTPSEVGVPEGVRDVVGRRLSLLSDEVNDVMRAAAVIGHDFDLELLSRMTDRDDEDLLQLLETPCARGLLSEAGIDRYRFTHALIRQTLYEEISAGRRARLHRKAAEAMETGGNSSAAQLARHHIESGPLGDPLRSAELALEAGDDAVAQVAWEQSLDWYRKGLDQLDLAVSTEAVERLRIDLLLASGEALNATSEVLAARPYFLDAYEAASRHELLQQRVRAALGYAGPHPAAAEYGDMKGREMIGSLLDDPSVPTPSVTRARLLVRLAQWYVHDPIGTGRQVGEAAISMAREVGDPEAMVVAQAYGDLLIPGRPWELTGTAGVDELLDAARQTGNVSLIAETMTWRVAYLMSTGQMAEGIRAALDLYRFAKESRARTAEFSALLSLNQVEIMTGHLDKARERVEQLAGLPGIAGEEVGIFGQRALLADLAGDVGALESLWADTDSRHNPFVFIFPWRAHVAALKGDVTVARSELARWREQVRPRCPSLLAGYADAYVAMIAAIAGDRDTAAFLYAPLREWEGLWAYAAGACLGTYDHHLGTMAALTDHLDEACEHLSASVAACEEQGYVVGEADGRLRLADVLSQLGRFEEAAFHRRRGTQLAEAHQLHFGHHFESGRTISG